MIDERRTDAMAQATRLTREGRLAEATALIQRTVGRRAGGGLSEQDRADTPPIPVAAASGPAVDRSSAAPEHAGAKRPGLLSRLRMAVPDGLREGMPRLATTPPPGPIAATASLPTLDHLPSLRTAPPAVALGPGQFRNFSYSNAAGERSYRLYVPTGYTGQPVPLLVMLHGGTQDATDFAAGTRMNDLAERHTFLVAYPEQSPSANPMKYWNWFQPADQNRGAGEPSLIAGITRQVIADYRAEADRVYIAGFSAGGAMAAVMAATYPDLYAAAGVHSGLPYGSARDIPSAFAAMKQGTPGGARAAGAVPLIVFHGGEDPTVRPINADQLVDHAMAVLHAGPGAARPGTPITTRGQVPGGLPYTRTIYPDGAGAARVERWIVHQAGHTWSGGSPSGSYTEPLGPDASAELVRFFHQHAAVTRRDQAA